MTVNTGLPIEILQVWAVTIQAGNQSAIIIVLMMNKTEASILCVVKHVSLQTGRQPALGGVACFTGLRKNAGMY